MRKAVVAAVAGFILVVPGAVSAADAGAFTARQVEEIETTVRAYLKKHPEVILEAAEALREREAEMSRARTRETLERIRPELERNPGTPVLGNPKGNVTIVEFFDYRCGYCKSVYPKIMKVVNEDGNVRLAMKELPILAPDSEAASRAALAADRQGKYGAFHQAAMAHRGAFDDEAIQSLGKKVGLDMARMKADMTAPATDAELERNRDQARVLELSGTPAFVIGETIVPGMASPETLKELVAAARKKHGG
ncbi:MAG: DsbA family protein [Alphaproteobacteria bacterium]